MRPIPALLLFLAIVSEVVGTAALKASEGFTRPLAILVVVAGYGVAFYLLSLSLRQLPLGVVYAIWSGLGTVGAVLLGVLIWQEALTPVRVVGIVMVVVGVVALNVSTGGS